MFRRTLFPVWIGIVLLSGMFLVGQDSWPPNQILSLPDTGQNLCYDNNGDIECPATGEPFYGQDAQYATGCEPSYTDNGDGTVTDNCTGLMWLQEDDNVQRNWEEALAYCEGLELAEYTDWRTPSVRELYSIVDLGRITPSIDSTAFPDTKSAGYRTSTTNIQQPSNSWHVGFTIGNVRYNIAKSTPQYVRCVR